MEKVLSLVQPNADSEKVLDLGCGLGRITEYLQNKTKTHFIGIDIASEALKLARERNNGNNTIDFVHGNMSEPNFPSTSFDLILSIDTLYYVNDLKQTMTKLKDLIKPGGKMLLFFSQYQFANEPDSLFTPNGTQLAQSLQKMGCLKYKYYDYTENERKHWLNQERLMEQNKENFIKEGNEYLYNVLYNDAKETNKQLEKKKFKRFLYEVYL